MRFLAAVLVLTLASTALAKDRYRGPALVWDSQRSVYRELTATEARFFRMAKEMFKSGQLQVPAAPSPAPKSSPRSKRRDFEGSDEELAGKLQIGADTTPEGEPLPPEKAGEVKPSADYKFEIGTFVGYLAHSERVKVGPALGLRLTERTKLSLDVAEQFLGASVNYDLTSLLRPSLGVGVGTELDGIWQAYAKASFRVW